MYRNISVALVHIDLAFVNDLLDLWLHKCQFYNCPLDHSRLFMKLRPQHSAVCFNQPIEDHRGSGLIMLKALWSPGTCTLLGVRN